MRRVVLLAGSILVMAALAAPAASAASAPPESVTLEAAPRVVTYGQVVHFSGRITPASGGQTVDVVDENGQSLAEATTRADGTYRADSRPDSNAVVHAQWGPAS